MALASTFALLPQSYCGDVVPIRVDEKSGEKVIEQRVEFTCNAAIPVLARRPDIYGDQNFKIADLKRVRVVLNERYPPRQYDSYIGFSQIADVLPGYRASSYSVVVTLFDDGDTPIGQFTSFGAESSCAGSDPETDERRTPWNASLIARVARIKVSPLDDGIPPEVCKKIGYGKVCTRDWQCDHACYPGPGDGTPKYCMEHTKNCAWPGKPGYHYFAEKMFNGKPVRCMDVGGGSRARFAQP